MTGDGGMAMMENEGRWADERDNLEEITGEGEKTEKGKKRRFEVEIRGRLLCVLWVSNED